MNRQRRQEAKKKQRERANGAERARRAMIDRSNALVAEADAVATTTKDVGEVRRLLDKALRIRPTSHAAHERLADLDFRAERHAEGLAHYEQLARPPDWPGVTCLAAAAAYRLGRFEQAYALARLFLRETEDDATLEQAGTLARQVASACKPLIRRTKSPGDEGWPIRGVAPVRSRRATNERQSTATRAPDANPPSRAPERALRSRASEARQPSLAFGMAPSGIRAAPGTPARVPARSPATPIPPAAGDDELPPFPRFELPELTLQVEVDGERFIADAGTRLGSTEDVRLRRQYAELRLQRGFDELISIASVHGVEHFWYQLETARRVLRDFRGRVLLADEVGLGKTIEACLALKEYWMRGLASKVLILTPPSLVAQWLDELGSKFGLQAAAAERGRTSPDDELWAREPIVVASLPLVRQQAYRARLAAIEYDLVIVDEAHVLKNRASAAWQLVDGLKKRFLFLLSATPVGNDLSELYNLVLLLKPGLLKGEASFRREFGGLASLQQPERRERLRTLLREVMIRNTRAHIDVRLPRRLAATEAVAPTAAEADLHERLSCYVRSRYTAAGASRPEHWQLMLIQMQAGSSPAALAAALERQASGGNDDERSDLLAAVARIGQPAKTKALLDLVNRSAEKKIVFTRFRAPLDHLRQALEVTGRRVAVFHGALTAADKERAVADFERDAEILLSSEVGGEGRNLQFCRTVINYDLPWNPMQLEQRVGRVHRIGQTRDVFVFNFCLAGSLEAYVLKVLHDKLNLFELVAGEMEMILGELDADREFPEVVMDLWARSATPGERDDAFERLAGELIAARARYEHTQEVDRIVFSDQFEV